MADVFISFIHEEERVARAVQALLRANLDADHQIFLSADDWQIHAGEVWLDRIKQELDEARVLLLLLSLASVGRPWVNFEAGAAWLTGKAVLPVCFGGLTKEALPKPYSVFQALNLREDYYYMVRSVHHWIEQGRQYVRLPPIPILPRDQTVVHLHAELDRLEGGAEPVE